MCRFSRPAPFPWSVQAVRSFSFILNLFHIIGVLIVVVPISTWFYQLTGKIYLGALLNALTVTWMFGLLPGGGPDPCVKPVFLCDS